MHGRKCRYNDSGNTNQPERKMEGRKKKPPLVRTCERENKRRVIDQPVMLPTRQPQSIRREEVTSHRQMGTKWRKQSSPVNQKKEKKKTKFTSQNMEGRKTRTGQSSLPTRQQPQYTKKKNSLTTLR